MMIILVLFAFISGFVTILAPCIWPLLPIILSSAIKEKGHKRPLGITLGIMVSFMIFTLTISYLVSVFHIDANVLRLLAVIVLTVLGVTMVVPKLSLIFELLVGKLSGRFQRRNTSNGFLSGFITGLSLGIVWSPCAGPILASIATLAATQQVSLQVVIVTLAYVTGVGIPLFVFAYGGQRIITGTRGLAQFTGRIQQVFGVFMIFTALSIYTNYDKVIQIKLLEAFPQFGQALNSFESNSLVTDQLNQLKGQSPTAPIGNAPEFVGISHWINVDTPLTKESLKGKVILIDFWTYTCINCIRTLPHVTGWYEKYKNEGFVVIGVHTPEFAFEKETENVKNAIKQYGITYPVAQDNDYKTWNAYQNQYWPAHYLIDAQGKIRYTHFGEGNYEETEQMIQMLLKENGKTTPTQLLELNDETPQTRMLSPEAYLGSKRMLYLSKVGNVDNGVQQFNLDSNLLQNMFTFGGTWAIQDEFAQTTTSSVLEYNLVANKVFLVARPTKGPGIINIYLDNKEPKTLTVDKDNTYELIDLKDIVKEHHLRLEFPSSPLQLYAFTFGD
jgi:cytochrome c biogenesis protein CcdA/thiol-disulfide isomerase/thioredoxin